MLSRNSVLYLLFATLFVRPAAAQTLPAGYSGPAAPIAPAVIARDDEGHATIRAVRVTSPVRIDGVLDDALYNSPPIDGFIQLEPRAGEPATERTDVWLAFDDDNIYVGVRCWDDQMDTLVATEMRRDSTLIWQGNDLVSIIFDPFYDRRNSIAFTINPLGGRSDGTVTNEHQYSSDWNPVWTVHTGRFEGGWTAEAALPFKSLRYASGRDQVWGFNVLRVKRSKNELSAITKVPPARGQSAVQQASYAATVVGLQAPRNGRTLDLKPFATSRLTTDRTTGVSNDPGGDVGFDAKYSLTQNMTADLTFNTDFAQVDADEQQVNLTRFSLFFPEKRDFFLENQGIFAFGGIQISGGNAGNSDAPILFYSRRIGLNNGLEVPLKGGGRLTGRSGPYSIGLLNLQTGNSSAAAAPATNFSVLRVKRDILRKSSIGILTTNRSHAIEGPGGNTMYGADAVFSFFENLQLDGYWARTATQGRTGNDRSYRTHLDYQGDRYTVQFERLMIGRDFNPEVGFVKRTDMLKNFGHFRFSPRPRQPSAIRKYHYDVRGGTIDDGAGRMQTRRREGEFGIEFQNGDQLNSKFTNNYEFLPAPFDIASGVQLPVGGYAFNNLELEYNMGQQRPISADIKADLGSFYDGRKTSLSIGRGRVNVTSHFAVEPTYSINRVSLAEGDFTLHLAGARVTYTMTPMMFASALVQYNSSDNTVSMNARLRWEYQPGSELFVVYNEERDTLTPRFPGLSNRALIFKINKLFRY